MFKFVVDLFIIFLHTHTHTHTHTHNAKGMITEDILLKFLYVFLKGLIPFTLAVHFTS